MSRELPAPAFTICLENHRALCLFVKKKEEEEKNNRAMNLVLDRNSPGVGAAMGVSECECDTPRKRTPRAIGVPASAD